MADTDPQTSQQQDPPVSGQQQQNPPAGDPQQQQQEQHVPYARFKQVNDELKTIKERLTALTGEKEQQQQAAQTLEQRLATLETERNQERTARQRLEVASKKKLPAELADRLIGDTPEALEADADRLLAVLKPASGHGVPPPSGGGRPAALDLSKMSAAEVRKARAEGKI